MTLPQGWAEATLGEIASIRNSKADPATLQGQPFIGLEHIEAQTSRLLDHGQAADVRSAVATFYRGDILYGRLRPYLNKVIEAPFDGCASAELIPFVAGEGVDVAMLRRWMMSPDFLAFTASLDQGDRPRVKADDLKAFPVIVPPEAEQRRIVAKLDALTARLARARAELDRVPVLAEKLRDSSLRTAFSAPASTVRIADIASRVTKGSSPGWQGYEYQSDGVLFVRSQNVRWGSLALDDQVYLPPAFNEKVRNSVIRKGDVLLNIVGASIGRAAVASEKLEGANCNQAVCIIRPTDAEDAKYLMLYLISPMAQAAITDGAVDVARANFSLAQAKSLNLPWPNAKGRKSIVEKIESAFSRADRLEAEAACARALLDRLESALLAKAFRGELVPQDPNDEPAKSLLDRIRAQRADAPKTKRRRKAKAQA